MDLRLSIANKTDFGLQLARHVASTSAADSNLALSPVSNHAVLALLTTGSKGATLDQLLFITRTGAAADLMKADSFDSGSDEAADVNAETKRKIKVLEYLQAVMKRLQSSEDNTEADHRKEAEADVHRLAKDDPDTRETLAMLGVIPPLIGMLDSGDLDFQIDTLYALLNHCTGKSCLITALAAESFSLNVPHVLPPTRLVADYFSECVPMTIINTSASPESREKLIAEVKAADVIVVTYDCGRPATNAQLRTYGSQSSAASM